jgi:RNA polymerase sigma factor (TIGR02999 family)
MSHVTDLLSAIDRGDPRAARELFPLVYDELRQLAAAKLAREPAGHTLQPTALVHEAYLRLIEGDPQQEFNGRGHFFGAASEAMRRILVDMARRKKADKRGGGRGRLDLDTLGPAAADRVDDLLALDEALKLLAAADAQAAQLVQLRYFGGLTIKEAAAVINVSPRTADSLWAYARAWLLDKLDSGHDPS